MSERLFQDHEYVVISSTGALGKIESAKHIEDDLWHYEVTFAKQEGGKWVSKRYTEQDLMHYIPPVNRRSHLMRA